MDRSSDSDIHLTWHNHHTALLTVLNTLLTNETLTDCTVSAEGKSIKAHKIILAACSPYFEQVFTENQEKHPIIFLPEVKFCVMKALLGFMYNGKLNVQQGDLGSVLKLSESLQLRGLSESGYISDVGTPGKDGEKQLLISTDNHSFQPAIVSVYTLRPQESSEVEIINLSEEAPLPHSLQENSSLEMDSVTSVTHTREKSPFHFNSDGNTEKASVTECSNDAVDNGFQVSDATETLPLIVTVIDKSDCGAVSSDPRNSYLQVSVERAEGIKRRVKKDLLPTTNSATTRKAADAGAVPSHPKNRQLQVSAERAKDINRRAKKNLLPTRKSARTRKAAFSQVTCNERKIDQVARKTEYVTVSASADGNGSVNGSGSVNRSDVSVKEVLDVEDISAKRGRAENHRPVKLQKKQNRKLCAGSVCQKCGKSYKNRKDMRNHFLHKCGKEPVQLQSKQNRQLCARSVCRKCGKSYKNYGDMRKHFLLICGKEPQFQCTRCKRFFYRTDNLRRHMSSRRCIKLSAS